MNNKNIRTNNENKKIHNMPKTKHSLLSDNTIENFSDFAKICMYNFGVDTHKYEKLNNIEDPEDIDIVFIRNKITEYNKLLSEIENTETSDLLEEEYKILNSEIEEIKRIIVEEESFIKKLNTIYRDCIKWTPPTKYHISIQDYMIKVICEFISLKKNIIEYQNKEIIEITKEKSRLTEKNIKKEKIAEYNYNLKKLTAKLKGEIEENDKDDEWIKQMLQSLPKYH